MGQAAENGVFTHGGPKETFSDLIAAFAERLPPVTYGGEVLASDEVGAPDGLLPLLLQHARTQAELIGETESLSGFDVVTDEDALLMGRAVIPENEDDLPMGLYMPLNLVIESLLEAQMRSPSPDVIEADTLLNDLQDIYS